MVDAREIPRAGRLQRVVRRIVEFFAARAARRMVSRRGIRDLDSEPIERMARTPFGEAYGRPQGRADADAKSFALEMLGRPGVALGTAALCLFMLILALANGIYAPR
jgi:hypothetical protein